MQSNAEAFRLVNLTTAIESLMAKQDAQAAAVKQDAATRQALAEEEAALLNLIRWAAKHYTPANKSIVTQ
jgi:hypothetical protein